ncbi:hypothetical protein G6F50_017901 [Rhizopus delemar]|uniref:Uncharacterized protein n=1 Tax=Rhizopus delemar TaxID=936053 RepID=A0A9P6XPD9_9FUNG|nr:hypothetical protein G6F50_017901 [Rhizopus delemar]
MPRCWNRCCCAARAWRSTARTTTATSAWRWRRTRTSLRRSAATPICWCIARSSTRCPASRWTSSPTTRAKWPRWRCSVPSVSVAPMRPSARSTSVTARRGWKSTSAGSSTA